MSKCTIPPDVDFGTAQAFFWACANGAGGGSLSNFLFVDPQDGFDASAKTGSLVRKWKTIQAALDKAKPGQVVALVPGDYDLGSAKLTWPQTTDVQLWGMPVQLYPIISGAPSSSSGGVRIFNDGSTPVVLVEPLSSGFRGGIANCELGKVVAPIAPSPTVVLAALVSPTPPTDAQFSFVDCVLQNPTPNPITTVAFLAVGFNQVLVTNSPVNGALIEQCGLVRIRDTNLFGFFASPSNVIRDPGILFQPTDLCVIRVESSSIQGLRAAGAVTINVDQASSSLSNLLADFTAFSTTTDYGVICSGLFEGADITLPAVGMAPGQINFAAATLSHGPGLGGSNFAVHCAFGPTNHEVDLRGARVGSLGVTPTSITADGFVNIDARDGVVGGNTVLASVAAGAIDRDYEAGSFSSGAGTPYIVVYPVPFPSSVVPAKFKIQLTQVIVGAPGVLPMTVSSRTNTGFVAFGPPPAPGMDFDYLVTRVP
jgi:hypothetical protein